MSDSAPMAVDTAGAVRALVAAMAPSRVLVVADGTELAGDLGYDSLRLMELGIALERAFDLTWLDPGQLAGVRTVADVVGLISTARDGAVR